MVATGAPGGTSVPPAEGFRLLPLALARKRTIFLSGDYGGGGCSKLNNDVIVATVCVLLLLLRCHVVN